MKRAGLVGRWTTLTTHGGLGRRAPMVRRLISRRPPDAAPGGPDGPGPVRGRGRHSPAAVRDNAGVSISDERRLVTIVFVDLVGFTSRSEATDPELVRDIQRAYFDAVRAEVERYGGRVEKYIGDAVMAMYGAPLAHDDDAERALHAALTIREAVRALGRDLEVRIGVNSGEVVGGAGSGPQAGEYTVTGDAVNVAARLQQAADPGEIYVGRVTRRLASATFEFAPMNPLELKGKSGAVDAWRLVDAFPERPVARGATAALVGRSRELALLRAALETAAEGRGLLMGLSGEAGIGKSRLALEVRARAEDSGYNTSWAAAPSYASSFPYHLVVQLARQLLPDAEGRSVAEALRDALPAQDETVLARWAAALADAIGTADAAERELLGDVTPTARQWLLVQSLGAVLRARAERRPQLIVLDDLHWADASSIAVLDDLLTLVPERPILVIVLYRPGWTNPWTSRSFYQQANVDRLRDEEARELVRTLVPEAGLDAERTEQLLHRSGGNPFFLEELVHGEVGDGGTHARRLPETVHELLLARIDALPTEARGVLQVASVVGMEFSERLVEAIEPVRDLPAGLAALQRDDLIVSRGGGLEDRMFAMRHPLVHEVAYRSLLLARRRVLHRRIGRWLEEHGGDEALAAIATHYREGDDRERAQEYLPRAAERAARLNARHEALRWYLEAADLFADNPRRRAEMLERAATESYLVGAIGRAIELVSEAIELYENAGDVLDALDGRRWRGRYYWMDGRGRQAEEEISAAVAGLEQLPPSPELALAYSYHSQIRMLVPDSVVGERLARQAIAVAEQVGSIEALVHAYNNLGMCRIGQGDPGGIDDVRRSLALALEHNLADDAGRAYTNLSGQGSAVTLFTYAEQEALYDEMIDFDHRVAPGGAYEQWHRAGQAELWIATGRWDDAERQLAALYKLLGTNRYLQLDVGAFLALIAAYRGRYEEAAERAGQQRESAMEIGDLQAYAPVFGSLAHAERGRGEHDASLGAIEDAVRLRGDMDEANISVWLLFEAVDVVTWLALERGADDPRVRRGIAVLESLHDRSTRPAERGGTGPELLVRRALYGAAGDQLRRLAGHGDDPGLEARARRFARDLRRAHRAFDAARIELWRAEAAGEAVPPEARDTFKRLRAAPYLLRCG